MNRLLIIALALFALLSPASARSLSRHVRVIPGPVNGVLIEQDGHKLVAYGLPTDPIAGVEMVLFTHFRRDVVWAAEGLLAAGAEAVVPAAENDKFSKPEDFWREFARKRYEDFNQQTTKLPVRPIKVGRAVKAGDVVQWRGLEIKVIDTPGYTRGAVSYLATVDGLKYAFVGDIIYGRGKLLDLYSLQDAVPEAGIGHYHGWAGRMGDLIKSLRRVKPARGPVIRDPGRAIDLLIQRMQAVYRNYLSINAGRWYFGQKYDILARRVLGPDNEVPWMDWAARIDKEPPDWVVPINNARLILSKSGRGFLIDCGGKAIVNELLRMREQGRLKALDGVFITHYHSDHTNGMTDLLKEFAASVYACPPLDDILIHPGAYRLPVISVHPIADLKPVPDGHVMQWREFRLTFYDFPGQTIYHDALLIERTGGGKMLFLGDSFTPSGIDDYCLQNRNLIQEGEGYLYCLDKLRTMPPGCLLNNQHVREPFLFGLEQIDHMERVFLERKQLLGELFPWDEPNYGIDERWVRFYPYGQAVRPGGSAEASIVIFNHSAKPHNYRVRLHPPRDIQVEPHELALAVPPRTERKAAFKVRATDEAAGVYMITADVEFADVDLRRWTEGMIEIAD